MAIPIEKFKKEYYENYDFLYKNKDKVAGYDQALEEFDNLLQNDVRFKVFVAKFDNYIQDILSSDRECVAFMFTLEKYL